MRTIGFPKSDKENEFRRVLVPNVVKKITNPEYLFMESGYGDVLGYSDEEYENLGVKIVSFEEAISKDIICDPKVGDAAYLKKIKDSTILFGWMHAVQNKELTDILIDKKITAYAWEDMYENGKHTFWKNNELAGEAAVLHAMLLYGKSFDNCKVALLGKGNTARGAKRQLDKLGAKVTVFGREDEKSFQKNIENFDIIVNCVLWDTSREDHVIYEKDLQKMKRSSLIIDISCDKSGCIETSIPTTLNDPIYNVSGVIHYVVDHTPTLMYRAFSEDLEGFIFNFLNQLLSANLSTTLSNSCAIKNGLIVDERINQFQKRLEN